MTGVRPERTHWRGWKRLSESIGSGDLIVRAVDIDFLLAEYDTAKAMAIVEYKQEHAARSGLRTQAIAFSLAWGLNAGLPV